MMNKKLTEIIGPGLVGLGALVLPSLQPYDAHAAALAAQQPTAAQQETEEKDDEEEKPPYTWEIRSLWDRDHSSKTGFTLIGSDVERERQRILLQILGEDETTSARGIFRIMPADSLELRLGAKVDLETKETNLASYLIYNGQLFGKKANIRIGHESSFSEHQSTTADIAAIRYHLNDWLAINAVASQIIKNGDRSLEDIERSVQYGGGAMIYLPEGFLATGNLIFTSKDGEDPLKVIGVARSNPFGRKENLPTFFFVRRYNRDRNLILAALFQGSTDLVPPATEGILYAMVYGGAATQDARVVRSLSLPGTDFSTDYSIGNHGIVYFMVSGKIPGTPFGFSAKELKGTFALPFDLGEDRRLYASGVLNSTKEPDFRKWQEIITNSAGLGLIYAGRSIQFSATKNIGDNGFVVGFRYLINPQPPPPPLHHR